MSDAKLSLERNAPDHIAGGHSPFGPEKRLDITPTPEPAVKLAGRPRIISEDFRQDLDIAFQRVTDRLASIAGHPDRYQKLFHALDGKSLSDRDRDDHIAMHDTLSWMACDPDIPAPPGGPDSSWTPIRYWPAVNPVGTDAVDLADQLPRACACAIAQDFSGLAFSADLGFRDVFVVTQIGLMTLFSLHVRSKGVDMDGEGAVARLCEAFDCNESRFDLATWPNRVSMMTDGRQVPAYAAVNFPDT